MICTLLDFSSMTMKSTRSVMDRSLCFAWLAERLWKLARIFAIQADMASGMVASDSLIASTVTKLRPWREGR